MLIFDQVYMTIDKKFEIIYRFWMNKREKRNKQKGSLKASEDNCSWSQSVVIRKVYGTYIISGCQCLLLFYKSFYKITHLVNQLKKSLKNRHKLI